MNSLVILVTLTIALLSHESTSLEVSDRNVSAIEQILLESFKKRFLKELGFSTVPNVSNTTLRKAPHILRYMVEADNRKYSLKKQEDYAKIKRIFLFPVQGDKVGKNYLFKVNSGHMGLDVKSATLWVSITGAAGEYELVLYRGYKANGKDALAKELFHSEQLNRTGWYSMNVTLLVKEWFSLYPAFNLSLKIVTKKSKAVGGGISGSAPEAKQPFLVVNTGEKKYASRRQRSSSSGEYLTECKENEPRNCCRGHKLTVDFQALGLDFIIQPRVLNTYVCEGVCAQSATAKNPTRAQVFINLNMFQPHACCRPIEFTTKKIVFFKDDDPNKAYVRYLHGWVAKCGCVI